MTTWYVASLADGDTHLAEPAAPGHLVIARCDGRQFRPLVALYVLALAQMDGVDLDSEIEQKIAKNARRRYTTDNRGVPVRVSEVPA